MVCLDLEIQIRWHAFENVYQSLLQLNTTMDSLLYANPPDDFPTYMTVHFLYSPKARFYPNSQYVIFYSLIALGGLIIAIIICLIIRCHRLQAYRQMYICDCLVDYTSRKLTNQPTSYPLLYVSLALFIV